MLRDLAVRHCVRRGGAERFCPAVLLVAVFHPARSAQNRGPAEPRGDRAAAEEAGGARAATALVAMSTRPPDGERNGETATGQVASRGGEIELGEIRVVEDDGRLQNDAEKEIGPADPGWHERIHSNPAFDAPVPPFVPLAVVSEPPKTNKHHLYRRKDYLLSRKQSRERERATRKAEKELARSGGGGGGGGDVVGKPRGENQPRESAG